MSNEPQANPEDQKNEPQTEKPEKTQAQLDAEERDNVLRKGIAPKDPKAFAKKLQTRNAPNPDDTSESVPESQAEEKSQQEGDKDPVPPLKTE